jgi:hypothetical protein
VARQNCVTQHEAGATEKGVGQDLRTTAPGPKRGKRTQESKIREHGDPAMRSMARRERERRSPKLTSSSPAKRHSSPKAQFCFFSKALRGKKKQKQIHFVKEFKLQMDLFFFSPFSRAKRTKTQSQPEATFSQNFRTPWPKRRKRGRKQALFQSFFSPS